MKKLKKYILLIVLTLLGVVVIYFVCNFTKKSHTFISWNKDITGDWQAQDAGYNLFSGKTTLVKIKHKPQIDKNSDKILVVYDESRRALICYQYKLENYLCQPVLLNKDKIEKKDKVNDVIATTLTDIPQMLVVFKHNEDELDIKGISFTDESCIETNKCKYLLLGKLKK